MTDTGRLAPPGRPQPWPPQPGWTWWGPDRGGDAPAEVTVVVCAAFDVITDAAVLAVRDRLHGLGVRVPARPRHRPHLTLAAARVHRHELAALVTAVTSICERTPPVTAVLARVGTFGRPGALWLGPDPSEVAGLRALHRTVWHGTEIGERAFAARGEPGEWVPHCSLVTRVPRAELETVAAGLRDCYTPLTATVAALAVIVVGGSGDVALAPLVGDTTAPR